MVDDDAISDSVESNFFQGVSSLKQQQPQHYNARSNKMPQAARHRGESYTDGSHEKKAGAASLISQRVYAGGRANC